MIGGPVLSGGGWDAVVFADGGADMLCLRGAGCDRLFVEGLLAYCDFMRRPDPDDDSASLDFAAAAALRCGGCERVDRAAYSEDVVEGAERAFALEGWSVGRLGLSPSCEDERWESFGGARLFEAIDAVAAEQAGGRDAGYDSDIARAWVDAGGWLDDCDVEGPWCILEEGDEVAFRGPGSSWESGYVAGFDGALRPFVSPDEDPSDDEIAEARADGANYPSSSAGVFLVCSV